ncbi:MAG: tetratricopeptide repeat protein, partial [Haliangium ochraceum]
RALTQVFEAADSDVVENAVSATAALASDERCKDVSALRAAVAPPGDKVTRTKVDEFRQRLADMKAQFDAGHWKAALTKTEPLLASIRSVNYRPLTAEALYLVGLMYTRANDPAAAERVSAEAYLLADACRYDEVRGESATNLVFVVGNLEGRLKDALTWFDAASAVVQRLGGHELLQAWLSNNLGCALGPHDGDAAIKSLQEAIRLKQRILGTDSVDVALSQNNLAFVLLQMRRYNEALAQIESAVVILKSKLGNNHPDVAMEFNNRGEALNGLGRFREGRESFERALAIWQRELGGDEVDLAYALTGIGLSYLGESNPDQAITHLQRALEIRESHHVDLGEIGETRFALARALWDSGRDHSRARRFATQARQEIAKPGSASDARVMIERWLASHTS